MPDTASIVHSQLDKLYKILFDGNPYDSFPKPDNKVLDTILSEANDCLSAASGFNLENKIVLAIATRLVAERFMTGKINDAAFVAAIKANQTARLLARFKQDFPGDMPSIQVLQRVLVMTPENIHLNSFMYEPIIDMADDHLRKLYKDVLDLK